MYIPAMAFITYLLVSGLAKGVLGEFHPDVLVTKCSSALLTNFFEVFLLRAALYTFAADVPCPIVREELILYSLLIFSMIIF